MPQREVHLLQRYRALTFPPVVFEPWRGSWVVLPTVTEHPPRRCSEQLLFVDMLLVSFP